LNGRLLRSEGGGDGGASEPGKYAGGGSVYAIVDALGKILPGEERERGGLRAQNLLSPWQLRSRAGEQRGGGRGSAMEKDG